MRVLRGMVVLRLRHGVLVVLGRRRVQLPGQVLALVVQDKGWLLHPRWMGMAMMLCF